MTPDWSALWAAGSDTVLAFLSTALIAALGVLIGWVVIRQLMRWVQRLAERPLGSGRATLLGRAVQYAGLFALMVFLLSLLGIRFTVLTAWLLGAAGIFGVALGFASQTSGTNVVSGLFLLGERPFDVGDFVEIDGIQGLVMSVDLMSVKLRTFDNVFVRVPNETAMKSNILNFSRFPIRRFDVIARFPVGVDVSDVERVLVDAAARDDGVLNEPVPAVFFQGVQNGQIELKLVAWASRDNYFASKTRFTVAVVSALRDTGHEIALPAQRIELQPLPPLAKGER